MKKVKLRVEYFKDLLDKVKGSIREERKEKGFELVDKRPDFATEKNLWTEGTYDKKIEGWEKLCIEAYLCGWIDYFDIQVAKVPDDARTVYFEWGEDKKETSLKVYLDSGSTDIPGGKSSSGKNVPKPPPPFPG